MKYILRVTEFYPEPGGQEKMRYIDDWGELFIGVARKVTVGKTYHVEVGAKRLGSCYRHITSWLDE
jgi:alanyl-tRNA synthetase